MISGKAVIFGDPHTGKSLLIDRLVRSSFSEHYGARFQFLFNFILTKRAFLRFWWKFVFSFRVCSR